MTVVTYKYRMYPTEAQKALLEKHFGCSRLVYNYFLNQRIQQYEGMQKSTNYSQQSKQLTYLKQNKEFGFLKEVSAQSLQYSLKSLDKAYKGFFEKKTGFPNFKSKKSKNTFTVPQSVRLSKNKLFLFKFNEGIKCIVDRQPNGTLKQATVVKTKTNKYFVSVVVEEQQTHLLKTSNVIGIDLGIKDFAVASNGKKFENKKHFKAFEKQLKKAQRRLAKKQKGSNGFEKQKLKVAKIHEKLTNVRTDYLHKLSYYFVANYDLIVVEDLNVKGMVKNRKLSKHIADASWSTFVRFLEYKSYWYGKQLVKTDRFFASSKTCNVCKDVNKNLKLSDRTWICDNNHVLDRDVNAAKNILEEGLKILSVGHIELAGGDSNKTSTKKQKSTKPETNKRFTKKGLT